MGRGKIESGTKKEKKRFSLGINKIGSKKQRVATFENIPRRREQSVTTFEKIAKEERVKCCCL